jgi:hypothetical protein
MRVGDLILELKIKLASRAVVFFCSLGAKDLGRFSFSCMNRLVKSRRSAVVSKMEKAMGLI